VADGWIPTFAMAGPDDIPEMRERIFDAARGIGRDPNDITLVYNLDFRIDDKAVPEPGVVTGSSEQIAQQLISFAELGFRAMNLSPYGDGPEEQVERLAREVIPTLRSHMSS
jgi:alkanesulfonate monooxygenase SsuD/methylene tetrahydromethanopterin reductase-like flavin-dependent oxidoreductase (luciferase family)